jgi:ribosomal protein S18 acetylase RimI-like enzyme
VTSALSPRRAMAGQKRQAVRVIDGPVAQSAEVFVRLATTDDGDAIGEVHAAAWQLGFGHVLHSEFLERASTGRRNGWRYAIAQVLALSNLVLVGGRDSQILAFSQSGQPDDGGTDLEIFAFYCHPSAWGTGLAAALMHETCAVLSTGARRAVLWTPREAYRARRFYERRGFMLTGRTRGEALSDWQLTPTYEEVAAVEYSLTLR